MSTNRDIDDIVNNVVPSVKVIASMRYWFSAVRRVDGMAILCDDDACRQRFSGRRTDAMENLNKAFASYETSITYPGERELYNTLRQDIAAYMEISGRAGEQLRAGNADTAKKLITASRATATYDKAVASIDADYSLNEKYGADEGAAAVKLGRALLAAVIAISAVVLVLCVIVGLALTKMISPALITATEALEVAARTSIESIVQTARDVEQMISLIATAATEQTAASGEISESATHISQLATENAQAADDTAAACKNLSELANDLDGVIQQFELGSDHASQGRRPAASQRRAAGLRPATVGV